MDDIIEAIAREQDDYGALSVWAERVLDVGAHIGMFTRWVLKRGAAEVVAYEPDEMNFLRLRRNVHGNAQVLARNAAIVGDDASVVSFWHGPSSDRHSTLHRPGRVNPARVAAEKLNTVIERYTPSVIKIDIEGGEWELLGQLGALPSCVRQLAMGLHMLTPTMVEQAHALARSLAAQEFTAVTTSQLEPPPDATLDWNNSDWERGAAGWVTVGVWRR